MLFQYYADRMIMANEEAYLGPHYRNSAVAQLRRADSIVSGHSYEPYVRYYEAKVYARLGRPNDALGLLEKIVAPPNVESGDRILEPFYTRGYMRLDPNLAPLRGNPRFEKLIVSPTTGPS